MPSRTCWLSLASRSCAAEGITAPIEALILKTGVGHGACLRCLTSEINEPITLIAPKLRLAATVDSRPIPHILALPSDQTVAGLLGRRLPRPFCKAMSALFAGNIRPPAGFLD